MEPINLPYLAPALRGALASENGTLPILVLDDSPAARNKAAEAPLTLTGLPDDLENDDADWVQEKVGKTSPAVVGVEGLGLLGVADSAARARARVGAFLANEDPTAAGSDIPSPEGRAAGKVILVTGSAQGFGLGIAEDLARAGAHVLLADINLEGAQAAAEKLTDEVGPNRAVAVQMNVCDSESVMQSMQDTVRFFGGLDTLICNAGVLKAESVKTQSEKDFDFVNNVNYRGYFLCAKYFSPVMAAQHKTNPAYRSDIIQINSKSGLQGSNRNFAYAGGKFGGIGLTQSFAMELVEDGIKVNSICPGNFFDGPLWSDPEKGLFVQYLRTGKIPGAKTIEDVKKGYEAKVLMGRGCMVRDVMHAVYYAMDQQYETGQAIPVTGGQVMLK